MTRESDWYGAFDALTSAGVQAQPTLAVLVVRRATAFLGSENFSVGSMQYNRELGLITNNGPVVAKLIQILGKDAAGGQLWHV